MAAAHQRGNSRFMKKTEGGKDIFILYPDALNVIWGGKGTNERYWKRVKVENGSPTENDALELVGVYWLEVSGKIPLRKFKEGSKYKMQFRIKMKTNASGWDNYDVYFNLRLTGQKSKQESIRLSTITRDSWISVPDKALEFTVPAGDKNSALTFAMYEIECEDLKTGLLIKEVTIEEI